MPNCPLCSADATQQHPGTPYWMCPGCDLWFQSPLPPKVYEAAHESPGHLMSEYERSVNRSLAQHLVTKVIGKPGRTLDIGSKYPFLAHCLKQLGCESFGMDNIQSVPEYSESLGVPMLMTDFETWEPSVERFALVTLIHCWEHFYDPLKAMRKLRRLVRSDGRVFIRMPDHKVPGFERDLTPGHMTIHPYFHALSSILEVLRQTDTFVVQQYAPLQPGQCDLILRPMI